MLLDRFRQPIAKQSKLSIACRRGNPIPAVRRIFASPRGGPVSASPFVARALLAGFAGLLFSAGHAAAQASPTWMGDLKPRIGHLQLNQLAIPGTHDTGTYSLDKNSIPSVDSFVFGLKQTADSDLDAYGDPFGLIKAAFDAALDSILNPTVFTWAQAQDEDIVAQLNSGIRYFDIRPCPYPKPPADPSSPTDVTDIKICHSLFGDSITDVLGKIKQFSLDHRDEIIIVDFNHLPGHKITGVLSENFAASIIRSFTNQNSGDMLIPFGTITPTSTLATIWGQSARILALYDDPGVTLQDSNNLLWPGQGVAAGPFSSGGNGTNIGAQIDSPSPGTDNVQTQLSTDNGYMFCRCDNPPNGTSLPNTLFVLQTNATPTQGMIGGYLIDQIESDTGGLFNGAFDYVRSQLGFESNTPSSLADLAYQDNTAILQLPTEVIGTSVANLNPAASPCQTQASCAQLQGLRPNLNIVQADRFESMYDLNRKVVPSNFVNSMILLDIPPQSTLSIGSPQYSASKQLFVTSATPFSIQATDSNFGVLDVSYDYLAGGSTWQQSRGPQKTFTLLTAAAPPTAAGPAPDGPYTITSFATNNVGLPEGPNTKGVTLDNTPPVITVTQPAAGFAYEHSSTLTLNYNVIDGSGSGVQSFTPAVLAGPGSVPTLASGQAINLLTQLPLGSYTFTFGGATDNLGNVRPATIVPFTIIATANSIKADVTQFMSSGAISKANWPTSLSDKLNQAAALRSAGDCTDAASVYNAFINALSAQSGKSVTPTAAAIMTNDAQYLIAHCP